MPVTANPSSNAVPVVEYRSFRLWQESNRYREIVKAEKAEENQKFWAWVKSEALKRKLQKKTI